MTTIASGARKIPAGPVHAALEEPACFRAGNDSTTVRGADIKASRVRRGAQGAKPVMSIAPSKFRRPALKPSARSRHALPAPKT
jgi:Ni,Fe-hydrogenase III large subunit